jgi:hypothetical protein
MALTNSVLITDNVADTQVNQRTATTDTAENAWVAAQGIGKRIYLLGLDWSDGSATTITIKSAADTIAVFDLAAHRGISAPLTIPIMTNLNEALNITTSAIGVLRIAWTTDQRIAYKLRVI